MRIISSSILATSLKPISWISPDVWSKSTLAMIINTRFWIFCIGYFCPDFKYNSCHSIQSRLPRTDVFVFVLWNSRTFFQRQWWKVIISITIVVIITIINNIVDIVREASPLQNGWIFGKVPNDLWPPLIFRKSYCGFCDKSLWFRDKSAYVNYGRTVIYY